MVEGRLLSAFEIGEGVPVLFVHGWQLDGETEAFDYEPILSSIPGFRRVYVDLPGMGMTPANNIQNQDDILSRLVDFVDKRIGESQSVLVGTSCGGYLTPALAQNHADQVDGLLLRVPLVEPGDGKRDVDIFEPLVQDEQFMASVSAQDKKSLGSVLIQTPAFIKALKAEFDRVYLSASRAADNKMLDPIRADAQRYRLSSPFDCERHKFVAPTLIVCARHDGSVGYRDSIRLLECYPRSTYAVLDRSTHRLPIDESERNLFEAWGPGLDMSSQ